VFDMSRRVCFESDASSSRPTCCCDRLRRWVWLCVTGVVRQSLFPLTARHYDLGTVALLVCPLQPLARGMRVASVRAAGCVGHPNELPHAGLSWMGMISYIC
jgi:hypothetical protein